jgi:hypothetical protein
MSQHEFVGGRGWLIKLIVLFNFKNFYINSKKSTPKYKNPLLSIEKKSQKMKKIHLKNFKNGP